MAKMKKCCLEFLGAVAALGLSAPTVSQTVLPLNQAAKAFGSLGDIEDIALSPDGTKIIVVKPGAGTSNGAVVVDLAKGTSTTAGTADGNPFRIQYCDWVSNKRVVCAFYGLSNTFGEYLPFTRMMALDEDGKNLKQLGQPTPTYGAQLRQFDGEMLQWQTGKPDTVLMSRVYVPQDTTYEQAGSKAEGLGVDLVDTRTLKFQHVEQPRGDIRDYITDSTGMARIYESDNTSERDRTYQGVSTYYYRRKGGRDWETFSRTDDAAAFYPLAIDDATNSVYALRTLDGRDALYRVALDGTMKAELVHADPNVDVDGVVRLGRSGRPIGVSYTTDKTNIVYFDPEYRALAASLAKAIPKLPLVYIISASEGEKRLILLAQSDNDPGRYYLFDKGTRQLNEILVQREPLETVALAQVKPITFKNADGTVIPAYLTLPPGSSGKGLPAIVMPHGGPGARDEWGFDWFAQFLASRGYAVLQPNYRGSTGFGDAWYGANGFKAWKDAISDVNDGGRWLVEQGIADPARLAIVGWSYGGYAALQSQVLDSTLYKAVVAVAPVTDLEMFRNEKRTFTIAKVQHDFIGTGPHIEAGSPARHADKFASPVLIFHGEKDFNVGVAESRRMDEALHKAGKESQLIVYPGLDHNLQDSAARIDMLTRIDQFLKARLKL
jgi:dipeptidyl aminopeptidase/acylaminoacyl peptidase